MPPARSLRRRAIAIVLSTVVVALLSGCSVGPISDGLQRIQEGARELLRESDGGPTGSDAEQEPGDATDRPESTNSGVLEVSVPGLRVGDCIGTTDVEMGTVELLPCDGPHLEEVYHEYRILEIAFPGDDRVMKIAEDECRGAFEAYTGEPWGQSDLDYAYWAPFEESWEWGDRAVICTLYEPGVELGGPLDHRAA